jgi:hypothetical protein
MEITTVTACTLQCTAAAHDKTNGRNGKNNKDEPCKRHVGSNRRIK